MTAIGLIILLVATGVTLDIVLENTNKLDASVVGQTLTGVNIGGFFIAGVIAGAVALLGLTLLLAGLRRSRTKAKERRHLVRENQGASDVAAERDRLAAELEQERARTATQAAAPVDHGVPAGGAATYPAADDRAEPGPAATPAAEAAADEPHSRGILRRG